LKCLLTKFIFKSHCLLFFIILYFVLIKNLILQMHVQMYYVYIYISCIITLMIQHRLFFRLLLCKTSNNFWSIWSIFMNVKARVCEKWTLEKNILLVIKNFDRLFTALYNKARLYTYFSLDTRDVYIVLYTRLLSIL
jgi:hypothetical protein